ncbi:hypothetical protein LVJ94_27120 [Pendulispora rubella]|uniref:Glycosyltransferase RgtA/B/C/D-like domain-containing protein n=1 Tax=Pendulispora rubella TaxID=2741070 RepID=A0ABZ2KWB3_9BACT
MMLRTATSTRNEIGLALATVSFASFAKLMAYLPSWGLLLYGACAAGVLACARRKLLSPAAPRPSDRRVHQCVATVLLVLTVLVLVVHPMLELWTAKHDGAGSDRDEALEQAALALVRSGRPYEIVLSTGHPISPLPGELILALPFVLVGASGLQNIAWLGLYYATLSVTLSSSWPAALGLFGMLLLAPGVVHEIVTAGDLLASSVAIATGCMWLVLQARRPSSLGRVFALGALFGVMLSSRFTYLLIVPLVFATLVRIRGMRTAWLVSAGMAIGFIAVTAPFLPWASGTFGPSHIFEKVNLISEVPRASWLIAGISCAHSVLASWRILRGDAERLFAQATYVLLTPVLLTVLLCSFELGIDAVVQFGWYALWCVPFATVTLARVIPRGYTPPQ